MIAADIQCGDGFRIATTFEQRQVVIRMDPSLAMAVGDYLSTHLPAGETIASKRFLFAAALANAGFQALTADSGRPAHVRSFVQAHVMASSEDAR